VNPGGFLADVLAEPAVLRAVADAYAGGEAVASLPDARRVLFLGMGSSRFAAGACAAALRARGLDAHAEYASTGLPQTPSPDTLCVAVSAGGGSQETLRAVEPHTGVSRTVAVTNRPESPLAAACDLVLPLHAGEEAGGVASRSYHATVAVLQLLAAYLTGEDGAPVLARFRRAADSLEALLAGRDAWLPALVEAASGGPLYVAAPAERLASAEQSALMLREGPRIPADACETGDWSHVDVYLSKRPGYRLLLLGGSAWEEELLDWLRRRDGTLVAVGRPVAGAAAHVPFEGADDPDLAVLVETAPAELLAWSLWAHAAAC